MAFVLLVLLAAAPEDGAATDLDRLAVETPGGDAALGYRLLTEKAYLAPPDFDRGLVEKLWTVWPDAPKERAQNASPAERRRMTFERYGWVARPGDDDLTKAPVGYVETPDGPDPRDAGWTFSCFACHAGSVGGRTVLGLPNTHVDLQTLSEESLKAKLLRFRVPVRFDFAAQRVPLSLAAGGTNAVMFGVMVGQLRDVNMDRAPVTRRAEYVHHNHDAPPWWHTKHKAKLYIDGFAPKRHRPLVQFAMTHSTPGEDIRRWADHDCRHILAYIESLEAPENPHPHDAALASRGRTLFAEHCASCHGTYDGFGELTDYPEAVIDINEVGTDRVRFDSLTPEHRGWLKAGWLSRHGADPVETHPAGYVAPPLTGVWATAPYLHNGSVPTLWHLLRPDQRPRVWKRTRDGYDAERVGLEVETFGVAPAAEDVAEARRYFDASRTGASVDGHRFVDVLSEDEKDAVLEYLKTL